MYHSSMAIFDKALFVSRLRERYDILGLIPEDLEKYAGEIIPLKTLKSYFNNKFRKIPEIRFILALCPLLQTNPEYLLGLSESPSPQVSPRFDRDTLIENLREKYRELNLLPMDLELFAENSGLDFGNMRDLLNDELKTEPGIDLLLGFCTLLKSTPTILLKLEEIAVQQNRKNNPAPVFRNKEKTGGRRSFKPALFSALTGAGLILAGAFAPVLRNNDGSMIILFKYPGGILLAILGLISLVLATIGNFRMLKLPAIGNLAAAAWAFIALQSELQKGQTPVEWSWLLIGIGTFLLLLATILKNDSR